MRVFGYWKYLVLFTALSLSWMAMAESSNTCGMCGKAITESSNAFVIMLADGEKQTYGCAGCGLSMMASLSESEVAEANDSG